jgi:CRP-like cAMP-binding protein
MPELELIRCHREQILTDADSSLDHVYFPDSGAISVVAVYADGRVIEMATIGREGCTGMQAFFGAKTSSVRFLVQIPGSAAKMSRAAFARAMESMPSFRNLMSAYIQAFLEQVLVSPEDVMANTLASQGVTFRTPARSGLFLQRNFGRHFTETSIECLRLSRSDQQPSRRRRQ